MTSYKVNNHPLMPKTTQNHNLLSQEMKLPVNSSGSKSISEILDVIEKNSVNKTIVAESEISKIGTPSDPTAANNRLVVATEEARKVKKDQNEAVKKIINDLRVSAHSIEHQIRQAEVDVFKKEEDAFFKASDEYEIMQLKERQKQEIQWKKKSYKDVIDERKEKRNNKMIMQAMKMQLKSQALKIRQQDLAERTSESIKAVIVQRRELFDKRTNLMENRHRHEVKQLVAEQDRIIAEEKEFLEIETRHLPDEDRKEAIKTHSVKINQQRVINKKKMEQLMEVQQLEMKQMKERYVTDEKAFQEYHTTISNHTVSYNTKHAEHDAEIDSHRQRMLALKDSIKLAKLDAEFAIELKAASHSHKAAVRQHLQDQKIQAAQRARRWKIKNRLINPIDDEVDENGDEIESNGNNTKISLMAPSKEHSIASSSHHHKLIKLVTSSPIMYIQNRKV
jgi:hypothetical protein